MSIDWSKAPEWAVAHGVHETGFGIQEFWLGETKHQNLEHAKSFPYGGGDPSCDSFHNSRRASFSCVTQRPAPWNGEGLPPVGTICEANMLRHDPFRNEWEWRRVEVVKSGIPGAERECLVYDLETTKPSWVDEFRPIRAPEQIAADERIREINALSDELAGYEGIDGVRARHHNMALYLVDQGYRRQEAAK